jgi:hypothetical protein
MSTYALHIGAFRADTVLSDANVFEEHIASTYRAEVCTMKSRFGYRYPHTRLHDITTQKTTIRTITAVKTSKLLSRIYCHPWYMRPQQRKAKRI